jgi:hypothetical protein
LVPRLGSGDRLQRIRFVFAEPKREQFLEQLGGFPRTARVPKRLVKIDEAAAARRTLPWQQTQHSALRAIGGKFCGLGPVTAIGQHAVNLSTAAFILATSDLKGSSQRFSVSSQVVH